MSYIGKTPTPAPLTSSDITNGIVTGEKLNADVISSQTALATSPADTDEFLISDAGVLKRLDASLIGGGKILQVVSANESANHSITSTSYVNSSNGLTLDITPSATSSKIFIMVSIPKFFAPSGQNMFLTLYRASSNIGGTSGLAINGGFSEAIPASFSIMDSPSSTSSLTYQVYAKTTGGTSNYGDSDGESTITAFEIGA